LGIILLAGGASSRLGRPKQSLLYNGKTLLQHGVEVAMNAGENPIIITVLGANAELLLEQVNNEGIYFIINEKWAEGIASSIRCGLQKLLEIEPEVKAVIMMVCDQPFVTAKLLNDLVAKYLETGSPIIASKYGNSLGTPALFDKTIFASLLLLKGDAGAKRIMNENPDRVSVVNFPLGNIDIDTQTDYNKLLDP